VLHGAAGHELGGHTRRGDRRTAPVRLKPRLDETAVAHAQIEAREVAAAGIFLTAGAVGIPHQARVPRVQEVLDQRRAVPHAAGTGMALRTFVTTSVTDATTYSTSSAVVERPSDERTAPVAQSSGTPIATSTCEGSTLPAVHAEPHDARHVLGAGAAPSLVLAAVLDGHHLRAAPYVEPRDPLRPVDLVARERQRIDAHRVDVDVDLAERLHGVDVEGHVGLARD